MAGSGFCTVLPQHDRAMQKNIIMISNHWNNRYCYNRLILENSIKITRIKIMRWETDER